MIIWIILSLLVLSIVIGSVMIAEWSWLAVKVMENDKDQDL